MRHGRGNRGFGMLQGSARVHCDPLLCGIVISDRHLGRARLEHHRMIVW